MDEDQMTFRELTQLVKALRNQINEFSKKDLTRLTELPYNYVSTWVNKFVEEGWIVNLGGGLYIKARTLEIKYE